MFDDFSSPIKGKGKEKDVGKRRAYVRVVTSLGGSLNLELFCEKVSGSRLYALHSRLMHYLGTKNMLQLLEVGPGRKV